MLNNRTNKKRLLKCLIVGTFRLIFIGVIITSIASAQGPLYNDYGDFPESFFNPTLSLSNSPYTNSFTSSLFPSIGFRGLENYGNYSYNDIFSPHNNSFLTSGSFVSPAFSLFNQPNANIPQISKDEEKKC